MKTKNVLSIRVTKEEEVHDGTTSKELVDNVFKRDDIKKVILYGITLQKETLDKLIN